MIIIFYYFVFHVIYVTLYSNSYILIISIAYALGINNVLEFTYKMKPLYKQNVSVFE